MSFIDSVTLIFQKLIEVIVDVNRNYQESGSLTIQVDRRINPMFIVLLKFSSNKGQASQFMEGHKEWINRGFDDGVFFFFFILQPNMGGGIVAHNTSLSDLQRRVNDDPFVSKNVVSAEILEITPSRAEKRLNFLLD